MFQFLNVHPKGLFVKDCVKRALTFATGKPYEEVSLELNRLKKKTKCKKFNDNKNWKEYIKQLGYEKISFPIEKNTSCMTGETFCEYYSKGTYILRIAHHLSVCKDGIIYDTWNCSEKRVYNAWKVPKDWIYRSIEKTNKKTSSHKKRFTKDERKILADIAYELNCTSDVKYQDCGSLAIINYLGITLMITHIRNGKYKIENKEDKISIKVNSLSEYLHMLEDASF